MSIPPAKTINRKLKIPDFLDKYTSLVAVMCCMLVLYLLILTVSFDKRLSNVFTRGVLIIKVVRYLNMWDLRVAGSICDNSNLQVNIMFH